MIINYSNEEVKKGDLSIFLAGPTPRNKDIISWRGDACSILERFGFNGIVYVPEYYLHTGKVIYGRPDNAIETKYLDWLYNFDYNDKPYNNLEDLLNNAILRTIEKED